jgi:hypothetical protein
MQKICKIICKILCNLKQYEAIFMIMILLNIACNMQNMQNNMHDMQNMQTSFPICRICTAHFADGYTELSRWSESAASVRPRQRLLGSLSLRLNLRVPWAEAPAADRTAAFSTAARPRDQSHSLNNRRLGPCQPQVLGGAGTRPKHVIYKTKKIEYLEKRLR